MLGLWLGAHPGGGAFSAVALTSDIVDRQLPRRKMMHVSNCLDTHRAVQTCTCLDTHKAVQTCTCLDTHKAVQTCTCLDTHRAMSTYICLRVMLPPRRSCFDAERPGRETCARCESKTKPLRSKPCYRSQHDPDLQHSVSRSCPMAALCHQTRASSVHI